MFEMREKMIACKCLNVTIETESDDYVKVNADSFTLDRDEAKDIFFKQNLLQIGKLTKINKAQAALIDTREIGSWLVHECLNCNICTHAVHREKGAGLVLVSSELLETNITELKKSALFSPVYNIIVNSTIEDEEYSNDKYLPAEVEQLVVSLKQEANERVKREVAATEERVRKFTEQQYAALKDFRDSAHKDHRALIRIILNRYYIISTKPKLSAPVTVSNVPVAANVPDKNNFNMKPIIDDPARPKVITILNKIQSPEKIPNNRLSVKADSVDTECMFSLEDMDESSAYLNSDGDLTDSEDRDDGIQMRKSSLNEPMNLAKSLPVDIPVFYAPLSPFRQNEDLEDIEPEQVKDIAASIKELAKSVHADTVFGDLPRPRCKTHI